LGYAADLARKAGAFLVVAFWLAAAPAHAACADPSTIHADRGAMAFTQTRHLAGTRAPLVSRGRVDIAPQQVNWHVTDPLDVLTTITPNGITQSIENGAPQHVAPQGAGDAFLSSAGLFDMLAGNFSALGAHYVVTRRPASADGAWHLRLTPRAAQLARFLSYIDVTGCDRVSGVEVREANGDWMEIALEPASG
jgi:hypothetical protein